MRVALKPRAAGFELVDPSNRDVDEWRLVAHERIYIQLPNGFCGLPVQKACPHANACLTCPMFLTTVEFLPQYHAHCVQTIEIITAAQASGHRRVADMDQQVPANLDVIIANLADGPGVSDQVANAS